jgi:hypothetical protein
MKKLLIVLWCLYFSATCKQGVSTSDLIFVKAASQGWSGGAAGSGRGVNYNFYFIVKTPSITCDSVWVDGLVMPVKQNIISNTDTIRLSAEAYYRGSIGPKGNRTPTAPQKENPPIITKGAAIISYTSGKSKKYVIVPTVSRLKDMNYP